MDKGWTEQEKVILNSPSLNAHSKEYLTQGIANLSLQDSVPRDDVQHHHQMPQYNYQLFHLHQNFQNNFKTSFSNGIGTICRFYAQGYCAKGERCNFIHGRKQSYPEITLTRSHGKKSIKHLDSRLMSNNGPKKFNNNFGQTKRPESQKNTLDHDVKNYYSWMKDEEDFHFLQQELEEGHTEVKDEIFVEIIDYIVELMTDSIGKSLVQKLLEICNPHQRWRVLYTITRDPQKLIEISCDVHGSKVVQKVIETLKTPEEAWMLVFALKYGILKLITDATGYHVVNSCLNHLKYAYNEFMFADVVDYFLDISVNSHGCCVLKNYFDQAYDQQKPLFFHKIIENTLSLSRDQVGNYMVQHILSHRLPWATKRILNALKGNHVELSMHKCGSHVVEKCLKLCDPEESAHIVLELLHSPQFSQLLQDQFGNYIIQTALHVSQVIQV
ncbi:hypothetical protein QJS04_geneDACA013020 [Acorus gramineus]|uniref:Uncharacterized protein n=1 Tax=Acorus gramineus TaxID=55184 RepID=A0AAV9B4J5_ACOGR|nr:hypothetical protein QJS04_geneDACA013020 [Acorus gramineus]